MLAAPDAPRLAALLVELQRVGVAAPLAAALPVHSAMRSPDPTHPSPVLALGAGPQCCHAASVGAARERTHTPLHARARLRTRSLAPSRAERGARRAAPVRSRSAPGSGRPARTC